MTDETFNRTLAHFAVKHNIIFDVEGTGLAVVRVIVEAAIKEQNHQIAVKLHELATALNMRPGNDDMVSALDHLAEFLDP